MPDTTVQWKDDSEAIGEILYQFEKSFREGKNPTVESFLQGEGPARQKLLIELLHSDLELRLRAGQSANVANYVSRFPELHKQPDQLAALLGTEFRVLKQLGKPLQPDEYQNAYGQYLGLRVKEILDLASQLPKHIDALIGTVIGKRYKIIKPLGQGGMGTVYLAEQLEPVRRQVALKVIKGGGNTRAVIARFEAERQALAVMDHPNIARVYDGGTTEYGQPYFVMELVEGLPVTKYCDQQRLSPNARLELFVAICQAVQHAHQKGIIHRDLKPGNVLVTMIDGKPVPKVIDFGVAKATEQNLLDQNLGETGVVGTPTYMSPEQADPSSMDIDTRTDIYALGVILYELLTGFTPIDAKDFKRGALLEMLRILREVDPPKPSTKISAAEELPNIAANRNMEPRHLITWLRNDIDWIVMKALEKDRDRRYETANGFAADVQRYLSGEPVLAHPPSRWYQVKKFVKRNKVQVVAALLVVGALVAGMTGTAWQAYLANQARANEAARADGERVAKLDALEKKTRAEAAEAAARKAEGEAVRQLKTAQTVTDFLQNDIFGETSSQFQVDLTAPPISDLKVREALDRAATNVGNKFKDQPELEATVHQTIGNAYIKVGEFVKSVKHLERAAALRREILGVDHSDTLITLANLALAYKHAEKREQAIILMEQVRDARIKKLGTNHPDVYQTMGLLAGVYSAAQKYPAALKVLEQVRDNFLKTKGPDHLDTVTVLHGIASIYQQEGKWKDATLLLEKVYQTRLKTQGPDHLETLVTLTQLASAYQFSGRMNDAIKLLEQVHQTAVQKLGAEAPASLDMLLGLAHLYRSARKDKEAIELYEQIRDISLMRYGAEDFRTLGVQFSLASAYQSARMIPKARAEFEQVYQVSLKLKGAEYHYTLGAKNKLAELYRMEKNYSKAIPMYEEMYAKYSKSVGPEHYSSLQTLAILAQMYQETGKATEALKHFEMIRDVQVKKLGYDNVSIISPLQNLGDAYLACGKYPEAVSVFEKMHEVSLKKLGQDHQYTKTVNTKLCDVYLAAGKPDKAIAILESLHADSVKKNGSDSPISVFITGNLIKAYQAKGDYVKAISLLKYYLSQLEKGNRAFPSDFQFISNAITMFETTKHFEEGEEYHRKWLTLLKRRTGAKSQDYAAELASLGENLIHQAKWNDAETNLRQSLAIGDKLPPNAAFTAHVQSKLGHALLAQKKYPDAEPHLLQGYEGLKKQEAKLHPHGKTRIKDTLDCLIQLYTETNKPEETAKWRKELESHNKKYATPTPEKKP